MPGSFVYLPIGPYLDEGKELPEQKSNIVQVRDDDSKLPRTTTTFLKIFGDRLYLRIPLGDHFSSNIPDFINKAINILGWSRNIEEYRSLISGNTFYQRNAGSLGSVLMRELFVSFEDILTFESVSVSFSLDYLSNRMAITIVIGSGMVYILQTEREGFCSPNNPMNCTASFLERSKFVN